MGGERLLAISISPSPPTKKVHFEEASEEHELFQPTHTICTPRLSTNGLKYRAPDARVDISENLAPPSSVAKPNYDDSLRRVSVVLYQHIRRCEKRMRDLPIIQDMSNTSNSITNSLNNSEPSHLESSNDVSNNINSNNNSETSASQTRVERTDTFDATNTSLLGAGIISGLKLSLDKVFDEEHFVSPQYKYTFVRLPMVHPMTFYQMEKVSCKTTIPSVDEIYRFCKNLFNRAQLSAECTIVCLIYIERLMERASIPLLGSSWKPIVLCGLLLASKVWQDLSSWNVEISNIYPQFPLHCINRLERLFLHYIQWDLYISGSVYAKYYFALRSLTEKKDFRRRYNYTIKIDPPNCKRLEERSAAVKNELYSRSL